MVTDSLYTKLVTLVKGRLHISFLFQIESKNKSHLLTFAEGYTRQILAIQKPRTAFPILKKGSLQCKLCITNYDQGCHKYLLK